MNDGILSWPGLRSWGGLAVLEGLDVGAQDAAGGAGMQVHFGRDLAGDPGDLRLSGSRGRSWRWLARAISRSCLPGLPSARRRRRCAGAGGSLVGRAGAGQVAAWRVLCGRGRPGIPR